MMTSLSSTSWIVQYYYYWMILVVIVVMTNKSNFVTGQYTGCYDTSLEDNNITIGTPTVVCFQIGNTANSWAGGVQYMRLNFNPIADQYSKFEITNCTFYTC
jgi:hypothetical protein